MTQKELLELAQKFEFGTCSESEKKLLFDYCERVQTKNYTEDWDLLKEDQVRRKLLQRINTLIAQEARPAYPRRSVVNRRWYVAATITVLVLTASVFYYITNSNNGQSSTNAVMLKLHNGTVLNLDVSSEINILDPDGKLIASQKEKELNYSKGNISEKDALNTLTVPYGSTFNLKLSDGTQIYLNAGSSVEYPVHFADQNERQISISGEAYLEVAKDAHRPFIVKSDDLKVRVLGTKFNIQSYPEDTIAEVVLVEGSVCLYSKTEEFDLSRNTLLTPGHKASFNKSNLKISEDPVLTQTYTSWVKGELIFRNRTFDDILKTLERAYDIKFINKNEKLSKDVFNANFGKNPSIENVLKELRTTYGINYQIKGNLIIIS